MLRRAGHTEAAVDLARLAGLTPAGVICEIVNDDGTMARLPELLEFAARARPGAGLHRPARRVPPPARDDRSSGIAEARLPDRPRRVASAFGYRTMLDGTETSRSSGCIGDSDDGEDVLARRALGVPDRRCVRLAALRLRRAAGRGHGGDRGRGPRRGALPARARGPRHRAAHKLQAYELQDAGADTVDANLELGLPADARDYGSARRCWPTWACARCACSPTTRPSAPA